MFGAACTQNPSTQIRIVVAECRPKDQKRVPSIRAPCVMDSDFNSNSNIKSRLRELGDVDLAVLVSLVAEQHCIFSITSSSNRGLVNELRLTCSETFGLQYVVVSCSAETTADEFNEALLVDADVKDDETDSPIRGIEEQTFSVDLHPSKGRNLQHSQGSTLGKWAGAGNVLDDRRVADVVIAVDLDLASPNVQVQALELLRSKRIFTRTSMHSAPKDMLFIAVLSRPEVRLLHHLNDIFGMSHVHGEEDGLPHLDGHLETPLFPPFGTDVIKYLRKLTSQVRFTSEMAQYLHHIVVFMRTSRFLKGGVTATATRQLHILCRALAPLHGIDYVPPSLVTLAARKIYPHRLILATPENEKTLQWGSDPRAIRDLLDGVTVMDVIEDVLSSIETPL